MARLRRIEAIHDVRLIAAVESGSRAWGFESPNSDFDVRFIYARRKSDYISLTYQSEHDTIEAIDSDGLDLAGWDIRKALKLAASSNPSIAEWSASPVVYAGGQFLRTLRGCIYGNCSVETILKAYHSMARGNYNKYVKGKDPVPYKRYLYVLRPLLNVRWILRTGLIPPVRFSRVSHTTNLRLNEEIATLVAMKRSGEEMGEGPRLPAIDQFIEAAINSFPGERPVFDAKSSSLPIFDDLLSAVLDGHY